MAAKTIASLAIDIGIDLSGFDSDMKEFKKTWGKLGGELERTGTAVGTAFTAAGGAVVAGLGFAVGKAMDFEAQMSKVQAIAGASSTELEAMRQVAIDLGASTSKSASEVAAGMQEMAAMGFDANQIMGAMPGVIAAAEASGSDMAQTAEVMASTLNTFGMSAEDAGKVADILAKTANISAADLTDMQYALKYAGPPANALGIGLEELSGAIGIMTNAGMKGEQAGTTLRSGLLALLDPSKENIKTMKAMGIEITDAEGNFIGLEKLVGVLDTSMAGMTDTQKAATLSQLVGKEAVSGFLSLMEAGPEKINAMTTSLQNSSGESATAAAIMKDNLAGSLEELGGAAESAQIAIGQALAPAIRAVADGLTGLINWFNELSPGMQNAIAIGAALAAGLLLLVGVVGFMAAALGMLMTVAWATVLPILAIIGVVIAVGIAIAALAALIVIYWDEIKAFTLKVWDAIVKGLQKAWDWIVDIFNSAWEVVGATVTSWWNTIKAIFTTAVNVIKIVVQTWWETVKTLFSAAVASIKAALTAWWEVIKTLFSAAFLAVYYIITGQWDKVGEVFRAATAKLKEILGTYMEAMKKIWGDAWDKVKEILAKGWTAVKTAFSDGWTAVKNTFTKLVSDATDLGKNIIEGMIKGIGSMISRLVDAAVNAAKAAFEAAKNFLGINSPSKMFMELGGYTGEGFALGLEDTSRLIGGAAEAMTTPAITHVQSLPGGGITPGAAGGGGGQTANVIVELDGMTIIRAIGEPLVETIRLKTGLRY